MEAPTTTYTASTGQLLDVADNGTLYPPRVRDIYTPPPQLEKSDHNASAPEAKTYNAGLYHANGHTHAQPCIQVPTSGLKRTSSPPAGHGESPAEILRKAVVEHQLGLSVNLVLLASLSWVVFPSLRHRMEAFSSLSYLTPSGLYGQGPKDLQLVLACVVIFTGIRAFCLDYVLTPLAGFLGIRLKKPKVRFAEQSYLLLYYSIFWTWGVQMFVKDTPSSLPEPKLNMENFLISLWTGYPRLGLEMGMKIYYLTQLAFWIQQILVIHLEERRKDHYQMLTHHFVTVALLLTSYGYRQCRAGNAVLICMDVVDLIFPLAKILRYLGLQAACDIAFALFVVTWLAARHAAYLTICWSIYMHVNKRTMAYGTYSLHKLDPNNLNSGLRMSSDGAQDVFHNIFQPFLNPDAETVSFNSRIRWSFLGLLLGLQCITLMWFVMICRVVARVLRGEGADDSRSDDEGEESIDVEDRPISTQPSAPFKAAEPKKFIEVESTADELSYKQTRTNGRESSSKRKSKGFSSSLNLGERKEILNRIGCLSEEQLAREREKRVGSEAPRPGSGSGR